MAKHMGHSVDIHKMAYRIHTAAIEVTKVGKVLTTLDSTDADKGTAIKNLRGTVILEPKRITYNLE
jgi:hypothetical protein